MASNSYTPPGVTVQEFVDPSISPLLATPASICLVGMAAGTITKTDAITLTGTTAVTLPGIPTTATMTSGSIVKIVDATNPSISEALTNGVYAATTDYTFSASNHTIARVGAGGIPTGNTVFVTYTYTPADYFLPIRLDNLNDIAVRFGNAYDSTGTAINSILTYAAAVAFENGAQDVVLLPLFYNNAGARQQPDSTQAAASATWADNFVALRDINDINIIVPVVGQSATNVGDAQELAIIQALQDHIKFMKDSEQQYIIGIVGEDSSASSSVGQMATLRTHSTTLASRYDGDVSQQVVFLSPSRFTRPLPTGTATVLTVGGQYAACAIAGALASRPVSQSLTRKFISGFTTVGETRTKSDKNTDAASGLMVLEQKANNVQVRHSITIDTTSTTKRELSIVRAKHRVIESVRDTLESQIVGQVIADGEAPLVVNSAVIGTLEELRGAGDIVDYGDVQSRTLTLDPTEIEVRFSYRPAFPVNFISIGFSLDLTTGDLQLADTADVDTSTF